MPLVCWAWHCAQLLSCVSLFVTPWTVTHQTTLSVELSRQEYQSGLISSSKGSLWPRDWTCVSCVSCIGRWILCYLGSPGAVLSWSSHVVLVVQSPPASAGDTGDARSGRSLGEGNGNPLRYSCLENYIVRGAWWAIYSLQGCKESDLTEPPHTQFNDEQTRTFLLLLFCFALKE